MEVQRTELNTNITNIQSKPKGVYNGEFQNLFDKLTGGAIAQEIRDNYDVTLDVGGIQAVDGLLNTYDFRCKNYVGISQGTLAKMEENPALKKKVMSAIEEFCSPEEQAKINALVPPVKSAGLIIYPDGRTLYWLEGYPNDLGDAKDKKTIISEADMRKTYNQYIEVKETGLEQCNIETSMQVLTADHIRKIFFRSERSNHD